MGLGGVLGIVAVFLFIDLVVVWAVMSMVRDGFFEPLHRQFPPREMLDGAVEKRFQSMSSGMVNMGSSMHIAVDDAHVHIAPAWVMRRLGGKPFAVPLAEVRVKSEAKLAKAKWEWWPVAGKFGKVEVSAPAWVFREVARRVAGRAGGERGDDGKEQTA
jgi:hypothetical protein